MGFFSANELTEDKIIVTTRISSNVKYKYNFICIEDKEINSKNIKKYIFEAIKEFDDCDTLYNFQRTQQGFCGVVGSSS